MGRDSSEIEQDIEKQRERIAEKVDHLEDRIESDIGKTQAAVKRQVTSAFGLDAVVRRRMPMTVAGAFGGALLLGVATGAQRKRS